MEKILKNTEKSKKSIKTQELGLGISAVIPTRGDVVLDKIIESILEAGIIDIIIADYDKGVYNRFLGIEKAKNDIIYTQDDDCVVDVKEVIKNYQPNIVVNNMPIDRRDMYKDDITLIGWGAVFDKKLVNVLEGWEKDDLFLRECDRVFTALNKHKEILADFNSLPYSDDSFRMCNEDRHWEDLELIKQKIDEYKRFRV